MSKLSVTTNFLHELTHSSVSSDLQACQAFNRGYLQSRVLPHTQSYKTELEGLGTNLLELWEQGMTELCRTRVCFLVEPDRNGCR